jgi:dihydropyrimidinase
MTYPPLNLDDGEMLEAMMRARELGMATMVHAENSDIIDMYVSSMKGLDVIFRA